MHPPRRLKLAGFDRAGFSGVRWVPAFALGGTRDCLSSALRGLLPPEVGWRAAAGVSPRSPAGNADRYGDVVGFRRR